MLWDNLLQKLYRGLFENSKDAIFITTREGLILDANQAFLEMFGYLEEELLTMNMQEMYVNASVRDIFLKEIEEKGAVKDFELMLRNKEGSEMYCLLSSSIHHASDGTTLGYQGIIRDITYRRRAEKLQTVSYNIANAAYKLLELEELFQYIHQELSTIIDTRNFYIALYDAEKEELSFPYFLDENYRESRYRPEPRSLGNGLTDLVIRSGKPQFMVGDRISELVKRGEIELIGPLPRVWLGVPLVNRDKIIGVIAVQSYSNKELYSESDIELMEFISEQIATTVERKTAENSLRTNKANLDALIENTTNGIFSFNQDLELITFNSSFARMMKTAYNKELKAGITIDKVLPKKEMARWLKHFKQAIKGKRFTLEEKIKVKNETYVYEISLNPIVSNEAISGVTVFVKNVTKRNKTQAKLLQMTKSKLRQEIKEQQIRAEAILEGQEEERQRIALELHDGLGQMLTAIKLNLTGINKSNLNKAGKEKLDDIKKLLNDTMTETKRVSQNLMPSVLKDFGLVPTIELLCEQNSKSSNIKIIFQSFGIKRRFDPKIERELYRITQEALNNSLKYAKASEINVQLLQNEGVLRLMVEDDGVGFNVKEIDSSKNLRSYRHGLYNMRERTNLLKGKINIDSSPNKGAVIAVEVPVKWKTK